MQGDLARAITAFSLLASLLQGCSHSSEATSRELPFYSSPEFTAEWVPQDERASNPQHAIAPFSLVDQNGQAITNDTLRGKIYVANFFFTSCPSICPKMAKNLKRIQDAFASDPTVVLVSHSVDPEVDTQDRLARYAQKVGVIPGKWHLLTGEREQIYTLARTSYFAEKQLGRSKTTNEFLHTENMLLIDEGGHIRGVYNATLPAEAIRVIEDIRELEREPKRP